MVKTSFSEKNLTKLARLLLAFYASSGLPIALQEISKQLVFVTKKVPRTGF